MKYGFKTYVAINWQWKRKAVKQQKNGRKIRGNKKTKNNKKVPTHFSRIVLKLFIARSIRNKTNIRRPNRRLKEGFKDENFWCWTHAQCAVSNTATQTKLPGHELAVAHGSGLQPSVIPVLFATETPAIVEEYPRGSWIRLNLKKV